MLLRNVQTKRNHKDSGSTLVPVVVLTSVGLLIAAILGNVVISSLDFTSRSRAQLQAEVSAEAGLLLAKKEIMNCQKGTTRFDITQSTPNFNVQIRNYPTGGGRQLQRALGQGTQSSK